jgi:hypothetical protein
MSQCKGDEVSNAPSSGSDLREVEPGAQASNSGAESEMAHSSKPTQKSCCCCSFYHSTTWWGSLQLWSNWYKFKGSKEKSTVGVGDSNPLYGPVGLAIWKPRPLPKILQELLQPVPKHLPAPAPSESLLVFFLPTISTEAVTVSATTNN